MKFSHLKGNIHHLSPEPKMDNSESEVEKCMNYPPQKENNRVDEITITHDNNNNIIASNTTPTTTNITEMTSKTVEEISHRIEEVFAKLQRNLEHNTRVFQEKSQGLLSQIDLAEDQLRKVLAQLESAVVGKPKEAEESSSSGPTLVAATESIALSEESTKLDADETTEN